MMENNYVKFSNAPCVLKITLIEKKYFRISSWKVNELLNLWQHIEYTQSYLFRLPFVSLY